MAEFWCVRCRGMRRYSDDQPIYQIELGNKGYCSGNPGRDDINICYDCGLEVRPELIRIATEKPIPSNVARFLLETGEVKLQ